MGNSIDSIVSEIAQELDCGNDCYYFFKTNQLIVIPNFSQFSDEEELLDFFKEDLKLVNREKENLIKFEMLNRIESFNIIKEFVDQITDRTIKEIFENILHNKKPFRNFKDTVENSNYRKDWFDFKQDIIEKRIVKQMKNEN